MEQNVLVIKMPSGEEVIAEVVDLPDGGLELRNPQVYMVQQGGFFPFMALAKDKTMVMIHRPVIIAEPSDNAKTAYLEVVAKAKSKIVTPPKKDIILAK